MTVPVQGRRESLAGMKPGSRSARTTFREGDRSSAKVDCGCAGAGCPQLPRMPGG